MKTVRRARVAGRAAAGLAVSCCLALGPAAQERRLADAIVPAAPPIVLEIPPGSTTGLVLEDLLKAAGVPFGLERAPAPPGAPPVDLGRRVERDVRLDGLRLGDALDVVSREDPRYDWLEIDGRVIVRTASTRGIGALDTRLDRFEVRDAPLLEVLSALGRAIDPSGPTPRVYSAGVGLQAGPGEARAGARRARSGDRALTLSLKDATLAEILNAVAREHGALSWVVGYDGHGTALENVRVSLLPASGAFVALMSARSARDAAVLRPNRLLVPVLSSLESMAGLYADRARVQVGIEAVPGDDRRPAHDAPPLDLTGVPPDIALSRIVAYDSRYVWEDAGGIFNIRPDPRQAGEPSTLDGTVESFVLSGATAEQALDRIARLLGDANPARGSGLGGGPELHEEDHQRRIAEGLARPLSLALTNVSLRQVLNALCRAHGALSWSFRTVDAGDTRRHTIEVRSPDGWSVSRTAEVQR